MWKPFWDPFLKNQNWAYLWISSLKFQFVLIVCQVEGYQNILKLNFRSLAFISYKAFWKSKRKSGTSLFHFLYDSWIKKLSWSINWPNFIVWLSSFRGILGNMYVVIVCYPGCGVINLEINLIFLINPFFLRDQKVKTKV